jgi:hypothetical protein
MLASPWIAPFRTLHMRVRQAAASATEREEHLAAREALARFVTSAQNLTQPEGQPARPDFRIAHAYPLELDQLDRGVTHDISRSGFSAILVSELKEGRTVSFSLRLAPGEAPMTGTARVVCSVPERVGISARISFAFVGLAAAWSERLQMALLDAALPRLH